jgi:hypothetical protein
VRTVTERWAYSVVDCQVHVLASGHPLAGMLPPGWAVARCGNPLPTIGGVDGDPPSPTKSGCVACAALVISGWSPVERPPSKAPDGRSAPPDAGLPAEVAELAALLAEVVVLAEDRAVFPSRLQLVAELATEHDSVRRALAAEGTGVVSPSASTWGSRCAAGPDQQ